jgi:quercetin dioxygenase-like cupin family protein
MKARTFIAVSGVALLSAVIAQETSKDSHSSAANHAIHRPDEIEWKTAPPSLPPGAKIAVLEGDPAKEGLFTMRALLPDGYSIPPHTHPGVEHVTVITGTLNIGMGEKFDKSMTQPMPAGTFGYWPAGMKHFAWAKGETILQVHGMGPWGIQYVNPSDDPRNQKEAAK